jgi:hypothetical protein
LTDEEQQLAWLAVQAVAESFELGDDDLGIRAVDLVREVAFGFALGALWQHSGREQISSSTITEVRNLVRAESSTLRRAVERETVPGEDDE